MLCIGLELGKLGPEDVSLFLISEGVHCVQALMVLGPEDVSLLERCPHFRGCCVEGSELEMCPYYSVCCAT